MNFIAMKKEMTKVKIKIDPVSPKMIRFLPSLAIHSFFTMHNMLGNYPRI
jgi:hypothetical protein